MAKLKGVDLDKQIATIKVTDKKQVIKLTLNLDLSKEVIDIKNANITLLKVGGIQLPVYK